MKTQGRPQSENIVDLRNYNQFQMFVHNTGVGFAGLTSAIVDDITGPFAKNKEPLVLPTNYRSSYTPPPADYGRMTSQMVKPRKPK